MMTEEGSNKIVDFMTPGVGLPVLMCVNIRYIVKMNYFNENLLYSLAKIRQTEGIVMMSKEGSTKTVNFLIPRAGILVLGRGQISHLVHYFFKNPLLFPQA